MDWQGRWRRTENLARGDDGEEESFPEVDERFLILGADGSWQEPDGGSGRAKQGEAWVLGPGDRLERLDDDRLLRRQGKRESIYQREPGPVTLGDVRIVSGYRLSAGVKPPTAGALRQALKVVLPEDPFLCEPEGVVVLKQFGAAPFLGLRWPLELQIQKKWVLLEEGVSLGAVEVFAEALEYLPKAFKHLGLVASKPLITLSSEQLWLGQIVSAAPTSLPAGISAAVLVDGRPFVGTSLMIGPGVVRSPTIVSRRPGVSNALWPAVATTDFFEALGDATRGVAVGEHPVGVALARPLAQG